MELLGWIEEKQKQLTKLNRSINEIRSLPPLINLNGKPQLGIS